MPFYSNTAFLSTFPLSRLSARIPNHTHSTLSPRRVRTLHYIPPRMVFTGIVEEMGIVTAVEILGSDTDEVNMTISASKTLSGVSEGDSISVNGTCLTVTRQSPSSFTFGLAPETLRRTNLGELSAGDQVNLERSLSAAGRFGGHVVQGHVDCTGEIIKVEQEKDALWFTVRVPKEYIKYVVAKGYVAVDGTSLTVCEIVDEQCTFSFMMITYTQAHVVTSTKGVGQSVNIEVDITGKYIERILSTSSVKIA